VDGKTSVLRPSYNIHIALAPTKNHDRLEWFVEKATEVGINCVSFFVSDHSERRKINHDRLQKVAVSGMKQSLKVWLPEIRDAVPFAAVLREKADQKFIAHLGEDPAANLFDVAKKEASVLVLIGPEGDFTIEELAKATSSNFQQVTLGPHRLRTETAALAAAHTLSLVNR
jgi:16S rRNA (uracil1498-N3)-methyltransferase